MRQTWSHDELLGTRRDHWVFTPIDAAAIRERLPGLRGGRPRGAS
jgi:hypothetical protein